ncbi:MAG: UDP-3-O-acylglucosamine N-acyltransferase 3 [Candidatus Tectimicrobiota bacterium]|nr:MAG: UDP-3-O-acylglucosamine N-acyltransferase 3 [Candidatus Tectomicrobia bacterium]
MQATLADLARLLAAEVEGEAQTRITGIAPLEQAGPGDLTFITQRRYAARLAACRASAVLVDRHLPVDRPALRVADPLHALIVLLEHFFPLRHPRWGIDPRAVLHPSVTVGADVSIAPYVVIEAGARLGDRVVVYPGTYIGAECVIGDECVLYANVSLYARVHLGRGVIVHSGAVIGADGFGFQRQADGSYRKIPQVGRVVIGDGVEIGANTCIDRATVGDTTIAAGTKIDNLVQIGHNVTIGAHTVLAGQVGLAGSVRVGAHVRMAGQVGVADHVTIGDHSAIGAQAGVAQDVPPGAAVWGTPAMPLTACKRLHVYTSRLGELFQQVRQLQQRVAQLEARERRS